MKEKEPRVTTPIAEAVKAYRAGNFHSAIKLYRESGKQYPHWADNLNATAEIIRKKHRVSTFGNSYPAEIKNVPEKPPGFPSDLILPALQGVANDYTFIEKACADHWGNKNNKYNRPVSIIVPVYNRSHELDFVLAGLTHQTYPHALMEIVIADDGSQEDLSKIYTKYADQLKIVYVRQEDQGYRLAEARNLGILKSSHDSIVILDSDAIPCATLIEEYMKILHINRNSALFGLRHFVSVSDIDVDAFRKQGDLVYRAQRIVTENSIATHTGDAGHSIDWREKPIQDTNLLKNEALPYRFLVGANCGFSKELFEKVGGYSDAFKAWGHEDQEFGYRLYREGAYFIPLMDAYVYHQEPLTGKNDTDRKMGQSITRDIFIQRCPFIYRPKSSLSPPFHTPLVSIYIPLFNREKYIEECIQSALDQSIKDLEVVICDDGSTDKSVEIIRRLYKKNPRVRLIQQTNGGIAAASNVAVKASNGFYIGQLDADDFLKLDAVEQCLAIMEKNSNLSLVYGTTEYVDEYSSSIQAGWNWPVFSREYLLTKMICHHFRLFRKRDWARTSGFNEKIKNAVDYDITLKLAEVGEVAHINRVLYNYRKHSDSTTTQDYELQTKNHFIAVNESLIRLGIENYYAVADSAASRGIEFKRSNLNHKITQNKPGRD